MSDVKDYDEIPEMQQPDPDEEAPVRERAYRIWEKEVRPEGRALEHWLRAKQEGAGATQESSPTEDESSFPR